MMERLPPEVQQHVCSYLAPEDALDVPEDLKCVRLTCRSLAGAAAPYMLPRLFVYNNPVSFQRLDQLTAHPIFNKYVTTLVYDAWQHSYFNSLGQWLDEVDLEKVSSRYLTLQEVKSYYEKQKDLTDLQARGGLDRLTSKSIGHAVSSCPKLENIVITASPSREAEYEKRVRAFKQFLPLSPRLMCLASHGSSDPEITLSDILQAVERDGRSLNSLTTIDVRLRQYSIPEELKTARKLKHLRVSFKNFECGSSSFIEDLECRMEHLVSAVQDLETFWLDLPSGKSTLIEDILPAMNTHRLRDLLITGFEVSEDALVRFLLRHSRTLRRLRLGAANLCEGSWSSVFNRISDQLPALERVKFRGLTAAQGMSPDDRQYTVEYEDGAADFVLYGGSLPDPILSSWTEAYRFAYDRQRDRPGQPEPGLWKDYDDMVNTIF